MEGLENTESSPKEVSLETKVGRGKEGMVEKKPYKANVLMLNAVVLLCFEHFMANMAFILPIVTT